MPNDRAQHLGTVWYPRYAADAMEAHLRRRLDWDARAMRFRSGYDDLRVRWGTVQSSKRQQPIPHLADIIAKGSDSGDRDGDHQIHLDITDFQSPAVVDVTAIVADDPRPHDAARVPFTTPKRDATLTLVRDLRYMPAGAKQQT